MRHRIFVIAMSFLAVAMLPMTVLADAIPSYDGRLEDYTSGSYTLDGGSAAPSWLLLIGLSAIIFGVLFVNSKRTHLD